jgi:S1-C subfamily serine protease
MKGGVAAIAVAITVALFVTVTALWAQSVGTRSWAPDVLMLEGPGSSIAAMVRDPNTDELSKAKLTQGGGALVDGVSEQGPAAKAGLKAGDVVVEFDGERVRSAQQFGRLVAETPPGRSTRVVVVRGGTRMTLDVVPEMSRGFRQPSASAIEREVRRRLESFPRDFELDFDFEGPRRGIMVSPRGRLGASVAPLTDQLAAYFGTKSGVLVSSIEADSPAAAAGLEAGDVVTSINGRPVDSPDDLIGEVARVRPGEPVTIDIVRDKKTSSVKATLPDRPARRNVVRARPI